MSDASSGWPIAPLSTVVDVLDRFRVPVNASERDSRQGAIPYFGATGQAGWIDAHLFDEELVLLGEDGAPFLDPARQKAYIVRGKSWVNNHAHVLRARAGHDARFLKYQLDVVDYAPFVSGTTRLKLPQGAMKTIPLRVPDFAVQRRVADAIDAHTSRLDTATATLERAQRNLKRYRASVLKAAVEGRLVPTEAALARTEGRSYEPASVLLERILAERRARWEASGTKGKYKEPVAPDTAGLPELPEGWCWGAVEQLADSVTYGTSSKTTDESLASVPVLRMGNIVDGQLAWESLKYLPESHDEFPDLLLQRGDLLFNRTNSPELVGKSAVFGGSVGPVSFASYLLRVRFGPLIESDFVCAVINSHYGRAWIGSVVTQQVGQANVNGTKLKAFAVPLPPAAEQPRIVAEISRVLTIARAAESTTGVDVDRIKALRGTILRAAFRGELV